MPYTYDAFLYDPRLFLVELWYFALYVSIVSWMIVTFLVLKTFMSFEILGHLTLILLSFESYSRIPFLSIYLLYVCACVSLCLCVCFSPSLHFSFSFLTRTSPLSIPPLSVRDSLIEQLPEGQRTEQHLEESIRSPQFRQSLGTFTSVHFCYKLCCIKMNFYEVL